MTIAILTILAALVPFAVLLMRRSMARKDNPETQFKKAQNENAKIIVNGDADALNLRINDRLNGLQNQNGSHPSGQGGQADASR